MMRDGDADALTLPEQLLGGAALLAHTSAWCAPTRTGLAVEESIVELHVHAASLEPHAVGPHSMTFLSLDFYEFETQLTPVLEGGCRVPACLPVQCAFFKLELCSRCCMYIGINDLFRAQQ